MDSIRVVLDTACPTLATVSDTPRLDAELLLAHSLGKPRSYLYAWPDYLLLPDELQRWQQSLRRRLAGEPIGYVLGEQEFWSLVLRLSPATLIPRPDTERLVELALERIPAAVSLTIADLGTGSGAIALAVAQERPHCTVWATDISTEALAVAKDNALRLGLGHVQFFLGDWFAALPAAVDMLVSNPPYIASNDPHWQNGSLDFEPERALVSGSDGLTALRALVQDAPGWLRPGGWLLVEHGWEQGPAVKELFRARGFDEITSHEDMAGHPRVCVGRWWGKS